MQRSGGQVPRLRGRRLDPDIREAFVRKQIMYVRNYSEGLGLSWQTVFRATEKEEVEAYLPQLVHSQDEPLADPVCVPLYYVTRMAAQEGHLFSARRSA